MTLGDRQYQWLQQTLAASSATFKLVFVHNLVGGLDGQMRGGIEAAPLFEWGGHNADETDAFAQKRPGWAMPIHQLLVQHGVAAVFHGHDHLYAKQQLDGIVYQEVPQPGCTNSQSGPNLAADYHYSTGTILSSSGHLRVTVSHIYQTAGTYTVSLTTSNATDSHTLNRSLTVSPGVVPSFTHTAESTFHTARPTGSTFTFAIQGDSHPVRTNTQFNSALYSRTLLTAAADNPDFYLTIGDDFSVDQLDPLTVTADQVTERYTIQRPYLGLIGSTAPVFLVNGNHEQAARYLLDGTPDNVAVWAQNARNSHYSQPAPDGFYTGNTENIPYIGLLRNHFAWTWGDALFVAINPYWASPTCVDDPFDGGPKRSNLWDITHGDAQYQWLKSTLEQSRAKYKLVFTHHVLGTNRGGIELAGSYEWGGNNNNNGTWGFATNRPTWATPIHQLMVANNVSVFFQGHDHIWVKQALDGVIYQTLPEPADPNYSLFNSDAFLTGDKFPNTGYTRVTVAPTNVKIDYVRTYLPADEGPDQINGATAFSYSIHPTADSVGDGIPDW